METKICCTCHQEKATTEFYHNWSRPDGWAIQCKECNRIGVRKYTDAHRDRRNANHREYCKRHPDRVLARKRKYREAHPEVFKRLQKAFYDRNPGKHRWYLVKSKYGITEQEWTTLFVSQGSCCAICGATCPGVNNAIWQTDHDHNTGKIRGILCHGCNLSIGQFSDSPNTICKAIAYLQKVIPADAPTYCPHFCNDMTRKAYRDKLLIAQDNKCAICGVPAVDKHTRYVDHDHTTNKVRGILCRRCNMGLGHIKDSLSYLQRAKAYLEYTYAPKP